MKDHGNLTSGNWSWSVFHIICRPWMCRHKEYSHSPCRLCGGQNWSPASERIGYPVACFSPGIQNQVPFQGNLTSSPLWT